MLMLSVPHPVWDALRELGDGMDRVARAFPHRSVVIALVINAVVVYALYTAQPAGGSWPRAAMPLLVMGAARCRLRSRVLRRPALGCGEHNQTRGGQMFTCPCAKMR